MNKKILAALIYFLCLCFNTEAKTLHIGQGRQYASLAQAAAKAKAGDTILFHSGIYAGGEYIPELKGLDAAHIIIRAATPGYVIIRGGNNAWHLRDAAYLMIEGFIFEQQTENALNIDDGGSYESPAHHLIIRNCTFKNITASGNNDLLKLSGVDDFEIRNCVFQKGSPGGSGIDMVGCHKGMIEQNRFEDQGANAIQAKGGSRFIVMERNLFKNCGQRSINLGGATGLQFFRPADAEFEAADLRVYANIFIGSEVPVAFVGCIRTEVINNTIIDPEKWVLRILQETISPSRFQPCGQNKFQNNLVYKSGKVKTDCNVGPHTASETFLFSANLWYNHEDADNSAPVGLPVKEIKAIIADPMFADLSVNFNLHPESPALGAGIPLRDAVLDFYANAYKNPPAIGAVEVQGRK